MVTVIGVRFRTAGKIYYFSPGKLEIKNGDHVIVETARGIEYGHVVLGNRDVEDNKVVQPLKAVIRMANKEAARHKRQIPAQPGICPFTHGSISVFCFILLP